MRTKWIVMIVALAGGLFVSGTTRAVEMVVVPGGGDPGGSFGGSTGVIDYVGVAYDFRIGKFPVTQQEWFDVMGDWPSAYAGADRAIHPVEQVTWFDTADFCNALSIKEGLTPVYDAGYNADMGAGGYRLATEEEWFKAAAWDPGAGEYHTYGFGRDSITGLDANFGNSGDAFDNGTTPVGYYDGAHLMGDGLTLTSTDANYYGLYDMTGNVWEWVQSSYTYNDPNYDPLTSLRTARGASWNLSGGGADYYLLASSRSSPVPPTLSVDYAGFRVVRTPEPTTVSLLVLAGIICLRRRRP